jgi:uncharacterized membrane protein SpoIIM required for sporulation
MIKRLIDELRPAMIVARREVKDQMRDWRIIFPIVFLTLFFPFLMDFTAKQIVAFVERYGATIVGERLVPFLLMIVGFFPISASLVIALETFVGEKERGSIEPLLSTPLKDWQLYLGKLLAATTPPLLSSFLGMAVYTIGLYTQGMHLPDAATLAQIISLTVIQALVMVSGAVIVSSQTTSVRAANLLASFIIVPVALLIQLESVVMFWGNTMTLWWIVIGLAVLVVLLVRVGLAHFQREELLGREIDVLNVRWIGCVFKESLIGNAKNPVQWYRLRVIPTVKRMGQPVLLTFLLIASGFLVGMQLMHSFQVPFQTTGFQDMHGKIGDLLSIWPLFSVGPVLMIWGQNIRVLVISLLLGIFSFGILGMLPAMISLGVAGYLVSLLAYNNVSPWLYFAGFILPHGLLEIPAVILATAAVLQMGAVLATPTPGKTVGEAWLSTLADWVNVMVGVVIPLLFVAAAVEAWITPRIALWLFH